MRRSLKYIPAILVLTFFICLTLLFYYASPEELINWVGIENAYIIMFVLALLGGLTTFSGIPYHLVLITLALSELNPLLLGVVTALGVMLGDSTSYYLGYQGRVLLSLSLQRMLQRLSVVKDRHPRLLSLLFFTYGSLLPFSNDLITIPAGFLRYPFWQVMIPLGLGNLIFNISLAFLASYAHGLLEGILF